MANGKQVEITEKYKKELEAELEFRKNAERERILREQEQEKQKSGFKKFIDGAKDFFTKLVSEKEEEK